MSDNYLTLIPTDPDYVPPIEAREIARKLLETFVLDADEVSIRVSDEYILESGGELSGVFCPACRANVEEWFEDLLDAADEEYLEGFSDLTTIMPCCGSRISLNDLDFSWPTGFSCFTLDALNPNINDLTSVQTEELEDIVGCKLRQIWEHI
jgi:hypothetical protein